MFKLPKLRAPIRAKICSNNTVLKMFEWNVENIFTLCYLDYSHISIVANDLIIFSEIFLSE